MFDFLRGNNNVTPTIVKAPTTASTTYHVGDALVLSSGALVLATGTTKPTHISQSEYKAPATGMEDLPCLLVNSDMEFKTTFAATPTSIVVGNKVTIHTDGEQVTATTTSGVAEVVNKLGNASGSEVIVKF